MNIFLQSVDLFILKKRYMWKERDAYKKDAERLFFPKACANTKRDNHLQVEEGRFRLNVRKKLYCDGSEALDEVTLRSCRMVSEI